MNYIENSQQITNVITQYFEGIYTGDISMLASSFHEETVLYGDIKGMPYYKTLAEYLQGVQERKSPKELGEPFAMDIISLEIIGTIAVAKLHVPMLGYNYYDLLSLTRIEGTWKIVHKLFSHVAV